MGASRKHFTLHPKWGQGKMEKTIHSDANKAFREWLVKMRHNKKLTQRQLASLLDVPHSWVGKVELGERRLDIIEYVGVCKALGVSPEYGLRVVMEELRE